MKKTCSKWLKKFVLIGIPLITILPAYARLYTIDGGSMAPTVFVGDRLLVNLASYDLRFPYTDILLGKMSDPDRGDLVVYNDPRGYPGMKRIIGVPGDEVELRENEVFVNGMSISNKSRDRMELENQLSDLELSNLKVALGETFVEEKLGSQRYVVSFTRGRSKEESFGPQIVPDESYFLLGDHRDFSGDSRFAFQGFMKRKQIIGRVIAGTNRFDK